jgi:putative ABC transport system permease protein
MPQDFRIALRSLLRAPGFAAAAILTLAVAIGMATSVFTIVDALLLRPLPYAHADRLALLWTAERFGDSRGPSSFDDFTDWTRDSRTLDSAALYSSFYKPILTGAGRPELLAAQLVSHDYFNVMRAHPYLGRFFLPAEDRDGPDDVVVLAYPLWRDRFHADAHIVGHTILLNARAHTVIGVAPPDMPLLPPSLASEPVQLYRALGENFGPGSRDGHHLESIVRLRAGVSIEQAQADLNVRSRDMERAHPAEDAHIAARIVTLRDDMTRNVRTGLVALQGAVLALMLIACANIANLLLAKSSARRREIAIRSALGAGRVRLARMLLAESLVLGLAGGVAGVLLAWWGASALTAVAARVLPDAGHVSLDLRVLAFSIALALAAAILFGSAPILRLGDAVCDDGLRLGTRIAGDRRNRMRQLLAAGQIALALMLLVAAGLLGRSFLRLRGVNPGFEPRGVITAAVGLPSARYAKPGDVISFFDRTLSSMRAIPGVSSAAIASVVPLNGDFDRTGYVIEGRPQQPGEQISPDRYIVSPDYFQTLQIPLRQGRYFTAHDDASHTFVCVISETAARLWFPGESPLGKKIRAGQPNGAFDDSPFRQVVGVAADVAQYGLGLPATPQIYMPHAQFVARFMTLLARTGVNSLARGDPNSLAPALRRAVLAADAEQPVYNAIPLEEMVSNSIATRRLGLWLLGVFAFGALTLASIGIYGVVSYSVTQRASEFGIRMALGATSADILRQAVGSTAPTIAAGLMAGLAGSFVLSKLMAGFLFGISARDGLTFASLPLFLAGVALVASYIPARRAAAVDPMTALKYE